MAKDEQDKETGQWSSAQIIKAENAIIKLQKFQSLEMVDLIKGLIRKKLIKIMPVNIGDTIKKTIETFLSDKLNITLFLGAIVQYFNSLYANSNQEKKWSKKANQWYEIQQHVIGYMASEEVKPAKVWVWIQTIYNLAIKHKTKINDLSVIAACSHLLTTNNPLIVDIDSSNLKSKLDKISEENEKKKSSMDKNKNTNKNNNNGNNSSKKGRGGRYKGNKGKKGKNYNRRYYNNYNYNNNINDRTPSPPRNDNDYNKNLSYPPPRPEMERTDDKRRRVIIPTKAREGAKLCFFFKKGICNRNEQCRWVHQKYE